MKKENLTATFILIGIILLLLIFSIGGWKIKRYLNWKFSYGKEVDKRIEQLEKRIERVEKYLNIKER